MEEFSGYVNRVKEGRHLSEEQSYHAFLLIMQGGMPYDAIRDLLTALALKGETVEEITGAVKAIRSEALPLNAPPDAMDVCGTGGDNLGTLNVSTAVAFVVAGCGIPVAKHGNKAISSKSGSADVLTALGVKVDADIALVEKSLHEAKLCFMMAPKFHSAMRHVAPVRAALKMRTIFNLVGPLCNPAFTQYQLLGVFPKVKEARRSFAEVLKNLGTKSAWVVHGEDGLDELTTTGISHVAALKDAVISEFTVTPEEAGLPRASLEALQGGDAAYNAERLIGVLGGKQDAYRDIVLLNSAAALVVAGKADSLKHGVNIASQAIDDNSVIEVLNKLVAITNS